MKKTFAPLLATAFMMALPAYAQDKTDAAAPVASKDAAAAASKDKDAVVLKVDGDDIKRGEVEDAWKDAGKYIFQGRDVPPFDTMPDAMKEKFLREVASEHVLYKEAQKEGLENSPEMQATYEKLKHQALIQELLKEKTKDAVTDEKLKASYDEHVKEAIAGNNGRDEVQARTILVKTKDAADAIEKKLKAGGDFDKIAKEKSIEKTTGSQGGEMGWFDPSKLPAPITEALLKLKKGEISEPIKTDFGWHIVKLEDTRSLPAPPFADVKESLKQEVGNKAIGDYVKSVMKDVKLVKITGDQSVPMSSTIPDKQDLSPSAGGKNGKDDSSDQ